MDISQQSINIKKILSYITAGIILITLSILFVLAYLNTLPRLEEERLVVIPEGTSLIQTGTLLEKEGVIRSALVFRINGQLQDISVKAGTYAFYEDRRLGQVLTRLHTADYGDVYATVTFPEGITIKQMAGILNLADGLDFNEEEFLKLTQEKEGYLFPDTYQFLPDTDTESIVRTILSSFEERTKTLQSQNSDRSWSDTIIMASLIEKEAGSSVEEQKIVSGILWKRIDKGIPLQVDAPFVYAIGKGSSELRTSDLRKDGPYNTYTRRGLPPTPIGNPGISAIEAALKPIESLYFFYLHDTKGNIHYGKTHDDHIRNKQRYL